jgi:hypothetical protein
MNGLGLATVKLVERKGIMMKRITTGYCALALLIFLAGCEQPHIEPAKSAIFEQPTVTETARPNCVLDVGPGKIKKCRPELGADTTGISGQLQIDGIRPDRHWTPMVALELSSHDEQNKLRITFSVKEYPQDADGEVLMEQTPFTATVSRWVGKQQTWSEALPAKILPATPFDFQVTWNDDTSLTLTLESDAWKTEPLNFQVHGIAVAGSGVMASTSGLRVLF